MISYKIFFIYLIRNKKFIEFLIPMRLKIFLFKILIFLNITNCMQSNFEISFEEPDTINIDHFNTKLSNCCMEIEKNFKNCDQLLNGIFFEIAYKDLKNDTFLSFKCFELPTLVKMKFYPSVDKSIDFIQTRVTNIINAIQDKNEYIFEINVINKIIDISKLMENQSLRILDPFGINYSILFFYNFSFYIFDSYFSNYEFLKKENKNYKLIFLDKMAETIKESRNFINSLIEKNEKSLNSFKRDDEISRNFKELYLFFSRNFEGLMRMLDFYEYQSELDKIRMIKYYSSIYVINQSLKLLTLIFDEKISIERIARTLMMITIHKFIIFLKSGFLKEKDIIKTLINYILENNIFYKARFDNEIVFDASILRSDELYKLKGISLEDIENMINRTL